MKIFKKLKDRRGIAIETAVLFMLVIFSLCALITTVAIIGRHQTELENKILLLEVEVDGIGEDFVAALSSSDFTDSEVSEVEAAFLPALSDTLKEKYDFSLAKTENNITLTVNKKADSEVVLYIETTLENEQYKVTSWRYSTP